MHDAMDVAEYVLNYCDKKLDNPITNLQLQKILYYIQGAYIAEENDPLFDNRIEAWRYGPVVPDVYYWYNDNMSNKIKNVEVKNNIEFSDREREIIERVVNAKIQIDPWELVRETHKEDPWKKNYIEGMNCEISVYDLEEHKELFL